MSESRPKFPSDLMESIKTSQMWGKIFRMAETDPGLKELLDGVIMYYKLKEK